MREISADAVKALLRELNPHWENGEIDPYIRGFGKRKYFDLFYPLVTQTSVHRAVVLMGPRRVGKTVILLQVIQRMIADGADPVSIIYLPLDAPLLQGRSLDELTTLFTEIFGMKTLAGRTIIFDEIQYLQNWSNHLKVLVDRHRETRFVASGSAAAALRLKSTESGAGRFTDFTLPPLTFFEFLELQGKVGDLFGESSLEAEPIPKDIAALNTEFVNYINYGGFPEAVFNKEIQNNPERFIRSDIIEKVLLRDLPSLYGIYDIQELTRLFNTLAYQTGNEVTFEGLSMSSGIAKNTIKKYIEYLEAAFLLKTINRVDNAGKTFKKINFFKVHLTNPSMYSALFGLARPEDENFGNLVETTIFSQWMHAGEEISQIVYARWKKGGLKGEVDLVYLGDDFKPMWCTEVKWSDRFFDNPRELRSLIHFSKQCDLRHILVTTISTSGKKNLSGLSILFRESAVHCFLLGRNLFHRKIRNLERGSAVSNKRQLSFLQD